MWVSFVFFFSSRRRHTRSLRDWSSDVCSSDLNPTGSGTLLKRLPAGEAYDIPLRCLMPKGTDGLIVAGRCISGTHEAHSSYRVMPIVMATGQAAGVCAALAARRDVLPRSLAVDDVQRELVRQGASLRSNLVRARESVATK